MIEGEEDVPDHEVVLKTLEPVHVVSLREVLADPQDVATLITDGFAALTLAGIMPTAPCFSVYHDPEFKPEDLDVEIAFPVPEDSSVSPVTAGGRTFSHRVIPGTKAAVTIHEGPYDNLELTYSAIGKWIADNGLRIVGPAQEAYLSAPGDPCGPVTEIRFPVKQEGR